MAAYTRKKQPAWAQATMFLALPDFWYRKVNLCVPVIDQSAIVALKALKSTNSCPTSIGMAERAR